MLNWEEQFYKTFLPARGGNMEPLNQFHDEKGGTEIISFHFSTFSLILSDLRFQFSDRI